MMEMAGPSARSEMLGCRGMLVRRTSGLLDCEPTMHRTSVQLHRLGQTYGKPKRQQAGETTGDQSSAHGSNIASGDTGYAPSQSVDDAFVAVNVYQRALGAALAIAPSAAPA
jgi:hypothetical protein